MTALEQKPRILFLCSENACRSQMAEALLRFHAGTRFDAQSAGLTAKTIHPLTLHVLRERGIATDDLRSKDIAEFLGKVAITQAIILCPAAYEDACPKVYPFAMKTDYWPFANPAEVAGTDAERLQAFRDTRDQIEAKIHEWLRSQS